MEKTLIGSINEGGLIKDLDKRGFSNFQCLCELLANSIDAKATEITFNIDSRYIKLIDNGKGLSMDNLKTMWSLFNANHTEDKSMGISN